MSMRRGLQPGVGVLLCIGTGAVVVHISDPTSKTRKYIASRASDARRTVLFKALSRRLGSHRDGDSRKQPSSASEPSEAKHTKSVSITSLPRLESASLLSRGPYNHLFVVTGPDADLTARATDHLVHAHLGSPEGCNRRHYKPPTRLTIPYGSRQGVGQLTSLVEEQLLAINGAKNDRKSPRSSERQQMEVGGNVGRDNADSLHVLKPQHSHQGSLTNNHEDLVDTNHASQAIPGSSFNFLDDHHRDIAPQPRSACTTWEFVVLKATRAVLNGEQLDRDTLWALERALDASLSSEDQEKVPPPQDKHMSSHDLQQSSTGSSASLVQHDEEAQHGEDKLPADGAKIFLDEERPASPDRRSTNFFLTMMGPMTEEAEHGETGREILEEAMSSQPFLCGELLRWGWALTRRGLGNVIISSPNPWVLAEVKLALLDQLDGQDAAPPGSSPKEGETGSSETRRKDQGDKEVIVVRVELPSQEQREQAVMSVAEELGVDDRLVSTDAVLLAGLTGGRRAGLIDVLRKLHDLSVSSRRQVSITEAYEAVVDDYARDLVTRWGLIALLDNVEGTPHTPNSVRPTGYLSSAGESGQGVSREVGVGHWSGATARKFAPLWEALAALSVPSVAVGAGPSPMVPVPPEGSMPPAQLLETCDMDPETLLRLTREGWLEVSPAETPGSRNVLPDQDCYYLDAQHSVTLPNNAEVAGEVSAKVGDGSNRPPRRRQESCRHPPPPVTVHFRPVPLRDLARLERSFVGSSPLRLAAFRRIIDATMRPRAVRERSAGVLSFKLGVESSGSEAAGAAASNVEVEASGGRDRGSGDRQRRHEEQLERAGCIIQASIMDRFCMREEQQLTADGSVLEADWKQLEEARNLLEREGKGDMSDGEWAEIQLELIRQERAVVVRAREMRVRRASVRKLLQEASALERFAKRSSEVSSTPRSSSRTGEDILQVRETTAVPDSGPSRGEMEEEELASGAVEDTVIWDAERGIRLLPLREFNAEGGTQTKTAADKGIGGSKSGGYGISGIWRWLKGLLRQS